MKQLKVKYTIHEVIPRLYCVLFDEQYDMCMTLCRWQEYYESNNPKIRNKTDTSFFDIMKGYSKRFGKGIFTYTSDWIGFNLPSYVFSELEPAEVTDPTPYDNIVKDIVDEIRSKESGKFYLIGVSHEFEFHRSMKHELAHGLWFLDNNYKKQMKALIQEIPMGKKIKFRNKLKKLGYPEQVIEDEIQAYMATGLIEGMKFMQSSTKLVKRFQETFKAFEAQSKFK